MAVNEKRLDKFFDSVQKTVETAMQKTGEEFIKNARDSVTESIYNRPVERKPWDLTGNLRNSIGYAVKKDGTLLFQANGGGEGGQRAKEVVMREGNKDTCLVLTAGMEYAAAVESRGYDVVSNSVNHAADIYPRRVQMFLKALLR